MLRDFGAGLVRSGENEVVERPAVGGLNLPRGRDVPEDTFKSIAIPFHEHIAGILDLRDLLPDEILLGLVEQVEPLLGAEVEIELLPLLFRKLPASLEQTLDGHADGKVDDYFDGAGLAEIGDRVPGNVHAERIEEHDPAPLSPLALVVPEQRPQVLVTVLLFDVYTATSELSFEVTQMINPSLVDLDEDVIGKRMFEFERDPR